MGVNKYKEHLYILPEDDANRQLVNGFLLVPTLNLRTVEVLPPAGGWRKVLDEFEHTHSAEMKAYSLRYMLLLIDFDEQNDRLQQVEEKILSDLKDRVFVLGVWSEPEKLKSLMGKVSYEAIGTALATGCPNKLSETWNHALLKHNLQELQRIPADLKSILFSAP